MAASVCPRLSDALADLLVDDAEPLRSQRATGMATLTYSGPYKALSSGITDMLLAKRSAHCRRFTGAKMNKNLALYLCLLTCAVPVLADQGDPNAASLQKHGAVRAPSLVGRWHCTIVEAARHPEQFSQGGEPHEEEPVDLTFNLDGTTLINGHVSYDPGEHSWRQSGNEVDIVGLVGDNAHGSITDSTHASLDSSNADFKNTFTCTRIGQAADSASAANAAALSALDNAAQAPGNAQPIPRACLSAETARNNPQCVAFGIRPSPPAPAKSNCAPGDHVSCGCTPPGAQSCK